MWPVCPVNPGSGKSMWRPFQVATKNARFRLTVGAIPGGTAMACELFYAEGNHLMVVEVRTIPNFLGTPQKLFDGDQVNATLSVDGRSLYPSFDVTADGQRFVVVQQVDGGETPKITVVENWVKEFQGQKGPHKGHPPLATGAPITSL